MSDDIIKFPMDRTKPVDPEAMKTPTKVYSFPSGKLVSEESLLDRYADIYSQLAGWIINGTKPTLNERDLEVMQKVGFLAFSDGENK